MLNGEGLKALEDFIAKDTFYKLLRDTPFDSWQSLDVDYEPPRVERVWIQHGDFRVNLHRIHPCDKALYHPHPWPSAVYVLSGQYEMAVGTSNTEASRQILTSGSMYEMLDPHGWHSVRPLGRPSLSLMLTWTPFDHQVYQHRNYGKGLGHKPLSDDSLHQLIGDFADELSMEHYR